MRYPGGKSRLKKSIVDELLAKGDKPYCEPFCGGANVGFEFLSRRPSAKAWLNDIDPSVTAVWQAVATRPEELKERICDFKPSVDAFYDAKRRLLSSSSLLSLMDTAFDKVVVHALSYHGMGVMAAGPLGGADQSNPDCGVWSRWSASGFCATIDHLHRLMANTLVTTLEYKIVLSADHLTYLDPPYYEAGKTLYRHSFGDLDHARLAHDLRELDSDTWMLSYDANPKIVGLYAGWAKIKVVRVTYNAVKVRRRYELLISPSFSEAA
jgi:DNA adenine methylase